jgi:hypothetical protein
MGICCLCGLALMPRVAIMSVILEIVWLILETGH